MVRQKFNQLSKWGVEEQVMEEERDEKMWLLIRWGI
jgi:hypothetical protein